MKVLRFHPTWILESKVLSAAATLRLDVFSQFWLLLPSESLTGGLPDC